METISLKVLIAMLNSVDQNKVIKNGLFNFHSFRGNPAQLAVELGQPRTVREILNDAENCVGVKFNGYKDGTYLMTENSYVYFSYYGTMDYYPNWLINFVNELFHED